MNSLIKEVGSKSVIAALGFVIRHIDNYGAECFVSLKSIELFRIRPLSRFAVRVRYDQATDLLEMYNKNGLIPFEPAILDLDCGVRILFPPVVEEWEHGCFVIDGIHRLLAARSRQIQSVMCIVVSSPYLPMLPCEACSWDDLRLEDEQRSLSEVLPNLDLNLFRPMNDLMKQIDSTYTNRQSALQMVKQWSNSQNYKREKSNE